MARSQSFRTFLFGFPAVALAVAGVFIVGVFVDRFAAESLGANSTAVVGGGVGLLLAMAMPLLIASRLIQTIGPERVHVSAVRGTLLAVWNAALVGGVVGLAPALTADALRSSADWLPGTSYTPVPTVAAYLADRLSPRAIESIPPPPVPTTASAEPGQSEVTIEVDGDRVLTASELFDKRADGVVVVKTRAKVAESGPLAELFQVMGQSIREGHGSGFVVGPDLIITNQHVVDGADEMAVVTRDGRTLGPVEALVVDADHDLALLRVADLGLPKVPLADSVPAVGADTFAIGAPLGLSHSLTRGIVSAHRDVQGTAFLQMQTTVAPGSSGGPLFDDHGRVVAVNTATRSPGLHLAVQVQYVHALLTAPRAPQTFATWKPGVEVASLVVTGLELRPTDRQLLANVLQMVASAAFECVDTVPPDARLDVAIPSAFAGSPEVTGTLPPDALACIGEGAKLASMALQVALHNTGAPDTLHLEAALVRGEEHLALGVQVGKPPAPAPVAARSFGTLQRLDGAWQFVDPDGQTHPTTPALAMVADGVAGTDVSELRAVVDLPPARTTPVESWRCVALTDGPCGRPGSKPELRLHGTEPFWSILWEDDRSATWTSPDEPEGRTFVVSGGPDGTWTLTPEDRSAPWTVEFENAPCSDGMSDASFNGGVTVRRPDGFSVHGCVLDLRP